MIQPNPIHEVKPMTREQFDTRLHSINTTYGVDGKDASARYEQELAKLFAESYWTQEQLAEKVGKSQPYVAQLLTFGRFLNFIATGNKASTPSGFTERRFRGLWKQTQRIDDDKDADERRRFKEVLFLIEHPKSTKKKKPTTRATAKEPQAKRSVGWTEAAELYLRKMPEGYSRNTLAQTPEKKAEIEKELGREIPSRVDPNSDWPRDIGEAVNRAAAKTHPHEALTAARKEIKSFPESFQVRFDKLWRKTDLALRANFDAQVLAEVERRLPEANKRLEAAIVRQNEAAERLAARMKHFNAWMTEEEFKTVLGCLHPDRPDRSENSLRAAFQIVKRLEAHIDPSKAERKKTGW